MNMNEGFDFTGMSDIDYTDTFADIDQAAEDEAAFTAGLRKALLVSVRTIGGTDTWVKGSDHVLDPLFAGAVSGSAADGWRVSLPAVIEGPEIGPASSSFAPIFGHFISNPSSGDGAVMDVALNLKAAPAAWSKSARWRLEPGAGVMKYELFILPGRRDGSLTGSPEYVAGDVIAGIDWQTANFMGIGNFRPSSISVCRSLAGAPKEVTGSFECIIDPDEFKRGPGFLNGAPLTVGGDYFTVMSPPDERSRLVEPFLWDDGGNIIPAFTDGMSRRYSGNIIVDVLHPVPVPVADGRRRRMTMTYWYIGTDPRFEPLRSLMFPDVDFINARVNLYGDLDAYATCEKWLREVNGVAQEPGKRQDES